MLSQAQRQAVAERLRRGRQPDAASRIRGGLSRRDQGGPVPASFGQEQIWFLDQFAPGQPTYNIPVVIRITGQLDPDALSRALDRLVGRHEALRTRLVADAQSRPVQLIDPPRHLRLDTDALTGFEPAKRLSRLRELIQAGAMRPFDLAAGPLLRASLLRLEPGDHVLAVVVHHAVFDGWSAGVLLADLAALYRSEVTGEPSGLVDLPVQFADYAVWERERAQGGALTGLESYWRQVLAGAATAAFPADRPRPLVESFDGALAERITDATLLSGLRELSRREGTTVFVTLLAALATALYRYTGQDDLVVGTVSANRGRPDLTPLIGFLVNTLPIRCDLSGDPSVRDLLARVKDAIVGAFAHQELPFSKIVDSAGGPRDPGRAPVFQVALSYAERDDTPVPAAGAQFAASDLVVGINAAKFDLTFAAEARRGCLWIECSYKTALFEAATVARLLGHLETLLRGMAASPGARLSQLPLLTAAELRAETQEWNDTAAPLPRHRSGCAHEAFEAQVAATPDAVAAQFEDQRVTYAGLNRQANQIARRLAGLGVGPETLAGVCMRAGPRRLAALLAIWKAGGGYVPLDPDLPSERLLFVIADASLRVILTDGAGAARLGPAGSAAPAGSASPAARPVVANTVVANTVVANTVVVDLDREWEQVSCLDGSNLAGTGVRPANVAYVIYTSGSTGQPKGVVVEHRNLVNYLHGLIKHFQIGPRSVVLQFASVAFDASVQEMFVPLLAGGQVVLGSADTLHSPSRLAALIRRAGVTFVTLTPAVLGLLDGEDFPGLQILMSVGEQLPPETARRWLRPGLRLVNGYGPTEATVGSLFADVDAATPMPPPIGFPLRPNYRAYVLDAHRNPVPPGAAGELYIGGAGVARGYLNQPELTSQRFTDDPLRPGERVYRTGDLVRRRADGSLVFLGRIDEQVKIRGVRIEPGEIEAALTAHPAVAQAVVTVVTSPAGESELAAYLRLAHPASAGAAESLDRDLRSRLARTLPAALIPAHLITLEEFPLNVSGKVDRRALPAPSRPAAATGEPPRTPAETVIAGIYARLLAAGDVGATDSFFDLGGNSLSAMRLVDLIRQETGADLSVTSVFLSPTPRLLAAAVAASLGAAALGAAGQQAEDSAVVDLAPGPAGLPLFLIHAVGGTVNAYLPLSRELAGTFRVRGLQSPGLSDPGAVATSLADLVTDYTSRIRAAQPGGPYLLAGWSMGGVIAYEVAQRIEQAGAEVSLLVLLDAPFALPAGHRPGRAELAGLYVADVAHSLGLDTAGAPDPAATAPDEQLSWLARRLSGSDEPGAAGTHLARRFSVFTAHSEMLAGYRPAPPPVRAPALIVSADESPNAPARSLWPRLLGGPVCVLPVPGDHYSFLRPPLVADVSAAAADWHAGHSARHADG